MSNNLVELGRDGEIAVILINNPPVNALGPGVMEGIDEAIEKFIHDSQLKAAVLMGSGKGFVAGADIKEFGKITAGQSAGSGLGRLLSKLEDCHKPIVAAIHGSAFGGGLELAMAAHYRVASPTAQVGQPEVKLGIIPGAGGTQRLPRLAGVAKAVEMCAEGNPIKAADALQHGIVDRLIDGDLRLGAVAFAREIAEKPAPQTRARNERLGSPEENAQIFAVARQNARAKQRNMTAPLAAIDAVEAATTQPFEQGCAYEQRRFMECLFSEQSKALIHVFFGEREVAKIPDVPKETSALPVGRVAVVGAGTMGGGIVMVFANAGVPVLLKEVDQPALDRGLTNVRKNYDTSVRKGRLTPQAADERLALIQPTLQFDGFPNVDLVVEAVFEGMELKKQVFGHLDRFCKPGTILASNTSTLNIDQIASATSRPEFVVGTHFFSPANVMRLIEIVRGRATSKEVIATCMQLSKKLGKVGVLVANCMGFVGNRMFGPYRREAQFLVEEGAPIEAVDQALFDFGMAMGPLATGDLAGLDVGWRIRQEHRHLQAPGVRQPFAEDKLCELGRFGQKTGSGWYKYDGQRRATADPEVAALMREWSTQAGIPQRDISAEEIVDRCIYALVNEGARILEQGHALRATDIDIIYLYGYGFPAYRGGPMWYADRVGLDKVYDCVCEFHGQFGRHWEPAPLLKQLAAQKKTFSNFQLERGPAA